MLVELLYFDGCPNHETFLPHLKELIAQAGLDEPVELRRVESLEAAEHERFLGSPTLRVDGQDVDPGAQERDDFGLKCRLYRIDEGLVGVPADEWVLAALAGNQPRATEPTNKALAPAEAALHAVGIPLEPFSRNRGASLIAEERALYRSILEAFASGVPPTAAALAEADSVDAETLRSRLQRLHEVDLVQLHNEGEIALAYPFSAQPTLHHVDTADGRQLWACCAIDALGIPSMLGVAATIHAREPDTAAEVEVSLGPNDEPSWKPEDALVLVAWAGEGSTARCICPHINFFVSPASAESQLEANPGLTGTTLGMNEATKVGRMVFGELLTDLAS